MLLYSYVMWHALASVAPLFLPPSTPPLAYIRCPISFWHFVIVSIFN